MRGDAMDDDPDGKRPQAPAPHDATAEPTGIMAWPDIARWRKAERERLIQARLAIPADERSTLSTRIAEELDTIVGDVAGRIVSLYWPFRGEPDLRPWMASVIARGGAPALPVVIEK